MVKNMKKVINGKKDEAVDTVLINVTSSNRSYIFACNYNPPKTYPCRWNRDTFQDFFNHVINVRKSMESNSIIFTADINFVSATETIAFKQ